MNESMTHDDVSKHTTPNAIREATSDRLDPIYNCAVSHLRNPDSGVSRPKVRRSSFAALDAQSILKQTKTGDTPIHRAAKQGRLNEIPAGLLSISHFLIANNDKRTALHVAAMNSHLDQVPIKFLTEETLCARDVYGSAVVHRAAEYGSLEQIPRNLLSEKVMLLRNKQDQTVRDIVKANRPTEKQIQYLQNLGVSFDPKTLTKGLASGLIDRTLRERRSEESPSAEQLAKVKRLNVDAEIPPNASKQDVSDVLEEAILRPATEAQFGRAAELGLNLTDRSDFTSGRLDDYLKLAERLPAKNDMAALARLGLASFKGTALEARLVLALAATYDCQDNYSELEPADIARACYVAMSDPKFYRPQISGAATDFTLDIEPITWPQAKVTEWLGKGRGG
jgi:hypothetical protein